MGFNIGIVTEILKFPNPLFPKYKHIYPNGFRFEIPETLNESNTYVFNIDLPDNVYELQSFTFSATCYNDTDNFELALDDYYILRHIYTKSLGQIKEIRPIVKIIKPDNSLKFVYNNVSGTSKIIWIDLDLTCKNAIKVT